MTYIILLNWNGWQDTIECLESVFRLSGSAFRVVVCDNGSSDDSLERIKAWARGDLDVWAPDAKTLRALSFPPVRKPIHYIEHGAPEAAGSAANESARLVIIDNGINLGFAAGNNLGIRFALGQRDMEYVWLLNNDTVVDPHSLEALVERARSNPALGLCGSTVLYYSTPDRVQILGGAIAQNWRNRIVCLGEGNPAATPVDSAEVEARMDFPYGASMLVSRQFLQEIGLLNEQYFLYFEEQDWAIRARGRYRLGYAPKSIVYHRGGVSVHRRSQSAFSQFHFARSGLLLLRTYYPLRIPARWVLLILRIIKRVISGDAEGADAIARAMCTTLRRAPEIPRGRSLAEADAAKADNRHRNGVH